MWKKVGIILAFLLLVLSALFLPCGYCKASEPMYSISESELLRLEQNLTELANINKGQLQELKTLKENLRQAKLELTMSKVELSEAKNSLRIAKNSLKQLEKEVQSSRKEHSIGIGQGTAGVAVLLEYNPSKWYGAWVYSDKQNKTVGLKINF